MAIREPRGASIRVGEDHRAVYEFDQPVAFDGGAVLTVVLEQLHGGGHLIGRPRISVTTATESLALDGELIPAEILAIVKKPAADRSDLDRAEIARYVRLSQVERELVALPAPQMIFAASGEMKSDALTPPSKRPVRMVHLLTRGDIKQAKEVAQAGSLTCVSGLAARFDLINASDEAARRAALAGWLTDRRNVLTCAASRIESGITTSAAVCVIRRTILAKWDRSRRIRSCWIGWRCKSGERIREAERMRTTTFHLPNFTLQICNP